MKHGRLADFFFIGLGIVPAVLVFGGWPDIAILLFVPLLFAACLFGMAEQVMTGATAKGAETADRSSGDTPASKPAATITLRERAATRDSPKA
jgi:hypothetical protein